MEYRLQKPNSICWASCDGLKEHRGTITKMTEKKNNTYVKLSYNISDNGRNVHYLNKSTSSFMIIRCSGIPIVCIVFDDVIFLTETHGFFSTNRI